MDVDRISFQEHLRFPDGRFLGPPCTSLGPYHAEGTAREPTSDAGENERVCSECQPHRPIESHHFVRPHDGENPLAAEQAPRIHLTAKETWPTRTAQDRRTWWRVYTDLESLCRVPPHLIARKRSVYFPRCKSSVFVNGGRWSQGSWPCQGPRLDECGKGSLR